MTISHYSSHQNRIVNYGDNKETRKRLARRILALYNKFSNCHCCWCYQVFFFKPSKYVPPKLIESKSSKLFAKSLFETPLLYFTLSIKHNVTSSLVVFDRLSSIQSNKKLFSCDVVVFFLETWFYCDIFVLWQCHDPSSIVYFFEIIIKNLILHMLHRLKYSLDTS